MKKVRKLSFLGILSVLTVVLFLAGISFMQAQVNIQAKGGKPGKPDKPPPEPEATWAVRIPTSGEGFMFYGMGSGYYENNDADIKVSVEKHSPGAWRRHYNFVYSFDFTLTNENVGSGNPPANQVGFQNVGGLYEVKYPDDKPYCQFPLTVQYDNCMAEFLNNEHPYSGVETGEEDYQYFWCRVHVFDQDIDLMGIGDTYLFGSASDPGEPGDFLSMVARYRQECYPEPTYNDIEIYRNINIHRAEVLGNPVNIMIERVDATTYEIGCESVWRIWVSDIGYHLGLPDGFLKVQERHCTIEKNKIKCYYPMEAKENFNFYIDFIKNPTAQ